MKTTKKHIGLIAMSGIRAENKQLLEIGLTLPGFVERSKVIASMPSLSLLTLAGLTPDEYHITYHEIREFASLDRLPSGFDLVAITSLSAQILEAYKVADHFGHIGTPVVMGGLHVSSLPNEALRHCRSVVVGEGEPVWPLLLDDFKHDKLRPIYQSIPHGSYDLARAPVPRFDLLDPDEYNRITVQTSRGCPHRCEFCASSILLTPHYKLKPVENVIREIHTIKSIWAKPFIEFADDNSFVHKAHYRKLMTALEKEQLRWFTESDISVADDPDLLKRMRDAGCQQVLIGLESPNPESLTGIDLASDWKARRLDRYLESIDRIQSHGITVNGCFILGLDADTPRTFDQVFEFVRQSGLYEVQITMLTPFPGTPLHSRLLEQDRIIEPQNWNLCTLFDVNIRPANMSPDELQNGFLKLAGKLYSHEETLRRRKAYHRRRIDRKHFANAG
ncbi:MAG: B12-binding domain-containing radical SAM protein [Verrucomicrobiales bacterium]|nr:radical SAM protein [Verrucomicrobiota bacterium JB025]